MNSLRFFLTIIAGLRKNIIILCIVTISSQFHKWLQLLEDTFKFACGKKTYPPHRKYKIINIIRIKIGISFPNDIRNKNIGDNNTKKNAFNFRVK